MPVLAPALVNEFRILVDEQFTYAFEDVQILETDVMTADTPEGPFPVTGASNTSQIVLTIGAHNLLAGRGVFVDGVGGNLAANGYIKISAVTGTTITIPVSGSGSYTTGGSVSVPNADDGHSLTLGEVILEHDVLAINEGVVGGAASGRVSYAY